MSAIWGIVDLSVAQSEAQKKKIVQGTCGKRLCGCGRPIGRAAWTGYRKKREATYYLACGVQNVTREAVEERFPYERKGERRSLFVADVILDNRGELVQRFGGIRDLCSHPDGEILYESFCSHPKETLAVARGAYACAYLEPGKRTLTLFNDAVGNRSVYYFQEEKRVYFSTLLAGITCERENWKENTGWFDRFYTIRDLRAVSEPRETPYAGILRLAPGEIVVFTEEGVHRREYWDPFAGRRILRGKTEAGYRGAGDHGVPALRGGCDPGRPGWKRNRNSVKRRVGLQCGGGLCSTLPCRQRKETVFLYCGAGGEGKSTDPGTVRCGG